MIVRAEVRNARTQVKEQDPRWLRTWYWPLYLIVLVLAFAIPETLALVRRGEGGTLSERTRVWLGIDPPAPRKRVAWATTAGGLLLFAVWFSGHALKVWPWEGDLG